MSLITKQEIKDNFECYIGGIFMFIATILTVINTFMRFFTKFARIEQTNIFYKMLYVLGSWLNGLSIMWMEDIIKLCFVWVVFMGAAGALRKGTLMGVDVLMQATKGKLHTVLDIIRAVTLFVCSATMLYVVSIYFKYSTKTTDALEISYNYANISAVISFALMTIYSVMFFIKDIKSLQNKDNNSDDNNDNMEVK